MVIYGGFFTGWWLSHSSENMKASWDNEIPNVWENIYKNVPKYQPVHDFHDFSTFESWNYGWNYGVLTFWKLNYIIWPFYVSKSINDPDFLLLLNAIPGMDEYSPIFRLLSISVHVRVWYLGKIEYFTNLNSSAIKGDDSPY